MLAHRCQAAHAGISLAHAHIDLAKCRAKRRFTPADPARSPWRRFSAVPVPGARMTAIVVRWDEIFHGIEIFLAWRARAATNAPEL